MKLHYISIKDKNICNASYRTPIMRMCVLSILIFRPYVEVGFDTETIMI